MAEPGVPAAQVDHHREPCPDRILDDLGGAFSMGAVGGGLFHSVKQMWWSPRGHKFRSAFEIWSLEPLMSSCARFGPSAVHRHGATMTLLSAVCISHDAADNRLHSSHRAIRKESPRMGGSFAVWGGLFASFDCTLMYLRQREDHWNAIAAGALTGGVLSARMGANAAFRSAVMGGVILAMIEGVGVALQNSTAPPPTGPAIDMPHAEAPAPPDAAPPPLQPPPAPLDVALTDNSGTEGSSSSSSKPSRGWLGGSLFGTA